jgi:hypothetical protein
MTGKRIVRGTGSWHGTAARCVSFGGVPLASGAGIVAAALWAT